MPPKKRKAMSPIAELIDAVYQAIFQNYHNLNWLLQRVILAAKNEDVREIMNQILTMLPGVVTEYKSIDAVVDADDVVSFPAEFLTSLDPAGLPPHRLLLQVGSPIISLRSLDPPKLCNGTRLCVKKVLGNVIEATILAGKGEGETVFIPLRPLIPMDLPFNFKRLQIPLRLAFTITINKSQGQSIKYCGVDLRTPCFSHGQLYVPCSRMGSPNNLFLLTPEGETKNVRYNKIFSSVNNIVNL
jgi:ATP-dependent DNA helicase PIF1